MDAGGLLERAPALPAPAPTEPLLDLTRRVWEEGDEVYRFNWILLYRSGEVRAQYERRGEAVFQTWFARIEKRGIRRIGIRDYLRPDWRISFDLPEDAEADILYNCSFNPETGRTSRIFTFGYRRPLPAAPAYFHIDTRQMPIRMWWSAQRIL